ncbi:hypothetical protein ACSCB1_38400 [Streptomyces europaeiscabiei]|uniref:hypothetical protein n=1 Tax=Streptomyces TaxID=1883 RepID=UPI00131D4BCF|nr:MULTISPECIES: hypothetical protein [Streptomyces]
MESGFDEGRLLRRWAVTRRLRTRPAVVVEACGACGVTAPLEVHNPESAHIMASLPVGGSAAHVEYTDRLLVLCANCHVLMHSLVRVEEVGEEALASNDQALETLSGQTHERLGQQVFSPVCVAGVEALRRWFSGDQEAVVEFGAVWLGLGAQYKEAVETALMGDWLVDVDVTDTDAVVSSLKREVSRARDALKPLWDRMVGGQSVRMLGAECLRGDRGAMADSLVEDRALPPDLQVIHRLLPVGHDPCAAELLETLKPGDRSVALMYAQGVGTWAEVGALVGAGSSGGLGERVRRMLKSRGDEHVRRAREVLRTSGTCQCRHAGSDADDSGWNVGWRGEGTGAGRARGRGV